MHQSWRYAAEKLREASGYIAELRPVTRAVESAARRPGPANEGDLEGSPDLWSDYKALKQRLNEYAETGDYSVNDLNTLAYDLGALADRIDNAFDKDKPKE